MNQHIYKSVSYRHELINKYLKETHSVSDIASHPPLTCNPNFILVNWCFHSWSLHLLVPIHFSPTKPNRKTPNAKRISSSQFKTTCKTNNKDNRTKKNKICSIK